MEAAAWDLKQGRGGASDQWLDERLLAAVRSGDAAGAKRALGDGASPGARAAWGTSALMLAAGGGGAGCVEALLSAGAAVEGGALMSAAYGGDVGASVALMRSGADPNERDAHNGLTPLAWAVKDGNVELLEAMLEFGGDLKGAHPGPPLKSAAKSVLAWVSDEEALGWGKPKRQEVSLLALGAMASSQMARALIGRGANPLERDCGDGLTAREYLEQALGEGHEGVARLRAIEEARALGEAAGAVKTNWSAKRAL